MGNPQEEVKHGRLNTGGPQPEPISEDASSFLKRFKYCKKKDMTHLKKIWT